MKILLLGDYSNVHQTLAQGLCLLGHEVLLASDGDGFKNYRRDMDISMPTESRWGQIQCFFKILKAFPKWKNFEVVQLINPNFTRIHSINLWLYKQLKKRNKRIFLGAFGDDYYYTKACMEDKVFRYSEFYVNHKPTNLKANTDLTNAWIGTFRQKANEEMARTCSGIVAGLVEYYMSYVQFFNDKLIYIPLPICLEEVTCNLLTESQKIKIFVGINRDRTEIKGSDMFLEALDLLQQKYPDEVELLIAESLPYDQYKQIMQEAHLVVDQAYSYSYAMNGLLALAQGKVLISGAEPEMYEMMGEKENHPVVNVFPSVEDIFKKLEYVVLQKLNFPLLSREGRDLAEKHHDHIHIARQYLEFWQKS